MDVNNSIERSKNKGLTEIASDLDFRNQTVLITGGADGIGAAKARALHQLGAHVIALDIQEDKLKTLAEELEHERVSVITFDLSQTGEKAYKDLAKQVVDCAPNGKIDAYMMNGGVVKLSKDTGVSGVSGDEFRKICQINAHSHADIYRALREEFAFAADARILATLSPIIGRGDPNTPAYAVSKRLLESYANNMMAELKDTDMLVAGYVPPPVQNFLRTDLKPNEPLHAHPHGEDMVEIPLRLISKAVKPEFNGRVIAFGYDHLRDKSQKLENGAAYDFMPRDPNDNGFVYDLRQRAFDNGGGDDGDDFINGYSTAVMREILGLGRTPDMVVGKSLDGVYETPEHVKNHRTPV